MSLEQQFFDYARERYLILLKRREGLPKPWTDDHVLQTGRFCNVFREDDRTTVWFRDHVREPMRNSPDVLLATVVFRWFNRTTTGEAIFCQPRFDGKTAWDKFLGNQDVKELGRVIRGFCGKGPYVTGAYTINTISAGIGLSKLDGVLRLIEMWLERHKDWRQFAQDWIDGNYQSMMEFCSWCESPCLKEFMCYEIACDLRYTALLERAHDIDEWANAGPGAVRGLNRIYGRTVTTTAFAGQALDEMIKLLDMSRNRQVWNTQWPAWDLRTVEHTLCEFDKYMRVRAGAGQTRGVFNGR